MFLDCKTHLIINKELLMKKAFLETRGDFNYYQLKKELDGCNIIRYWKGSCFVGTPTRWFLGYFENGDFKKYGQIIENNEELIYICEGYF